MHLNNFVTLLPISVSLVILSLAATTSGLSCDSDAFIFPMPCEGDICTAVRILSNGRPITVLECLNKNTNPHWRDLCSGLRDTNTTVTQCCIGEDSCSGQLKPRLPSEPPATGGLAPYRPVNDTDDDPSLDGLYVCTYDQTNSPLNGHPGYCYGHSCFSSVFRHVHNGSVEQSWGCLDRDTRNISLICGGSMNSEQEVYSCCTGGFRCNSHLNPQFPVVTMATMTTTEATPIGQAWNCSCHDTLTNEPACGGSGSCQTAGACIAKYVRIGDSTEARLEHGCLSAAQIFAKDVCQPLQLEDQQIFCCYTNYCNRNYTLQQNPFIVTSTHTGTYTHHPTDTATSSLLVVPVIVILTIAILAFVIIVTVIAVTAIVCYFTKCTGHARRGVTIEKELSYELQPTYQFTNPLNSGYSVPHTEQQTIAAQEKPCAGATQVPKLQQ